MTLATGGVSDQTWAQRAAGPMVPKGCLPTAMCPEGTVARLQGRFGEA